MAEYKRRIEDLPNLQITDFKIERLEDGKFVFEIFADGRRIATSDGRRWRASYDSEEAARADLRRLFDADQYRDLSKIDWTPVKDGGETFSGAAETSEDIRPEQSNGE